MALTRLNEFDALVTTLIDIGQDIDYMQDCDEVVPIHDNVVDPVVDLVNEHLEQDQLAPITDLDQDVVPDEDELAEIHVVLIRQFHVNEYRIIIMRWPIKL